MISRREILNALTISMARASDRIIFPLSFAIAGKYPTAIDVKRSIAMTPKRQCITIDNINPHLKGVEYLVRGPITLRADAIEKELSEVSTYLTCLFYYMYLKKVFFYYFKLITTTKTCRTHK